MTTVSQSGFLLALLLSAASCFEEPQPIFLLEDESIEMGFCFGADYIVVYKSSPEGDLLLGNSSDSSQLPQMSEPLSADIRSRVTVTTDAMGLLGLEINQLKQSDSGVYKRECWIDGQLGRGGTHYLTVCLKEANSQEIQLLPGGSAVLWCNHTSIRQGGVVRWYRDIYPEDNTTLFLDTSKSMEPLQEDLRGHVQVGGNGSFLHIPSTVMKYSHHYNCLVFEGDKCLSIQRMNLPERGELEVKTVLHSVGEDIILPCSPENMHQELLFWDTPFGLIDWTDSQVPLKKGANPRDLMYKPGSYSLAIPSLSLKHSGQYKCLSPTPAEKYSLIVCPERKPVNVSCSLGHSTALTCNPNLEESYLVHWYRDHRLEKNRLDASPPVSEGRWDRDRVSQANFSLQLSNLTQGDSGDYWCVVLSSDEYTGLSDEGDYDYLSFPSQGNADECFFSQRLHLVCGGQEDPPDSSFTLYVVCAVLFGCVLLGTIASLVATRLTSRRRTPDSPRNRTLAPGHGTKEGEQSQDTLFMERQALAVHGL